MHSWQILISKDGNGAVWVGFRPIPPRLDTRPKKTHLLPHPACFNGTCLTCPNRYPTRFIFLRIFFFNQVLQIWSTWSSINRWIGSDQTTIIGHLNPTCCRSAESKQDLSHRRSVRTDPVRGFCCAPFFRPDLIHASAANPHRERCYAVDG